MSLYSPRVPTNLLHHGPQNKIQKTSRNMAARKGPRLYKKQIGTHREKKGVLTLTLMLVRRKSACKTSAGSCKILRWLTPLLGPNMDPKIGVRNWITFTFLLLGLGPRFGIQIWAQKWGQPSENFAAARRCFASRLATHWHERKC